MFCPRCATQNNDDAKFCRACRENLKVITQAMERRMPVVLASKLDEYLERTNERLRRDSILTFLFGAYLTGMIITGENVSENRYWFATAIALLIAVSYLGFAAWQMLAYRRSLSLSSISAMLTSVPNTIYCPRCAESNEDGTKFCRKCGENLRVVSQAMTRRLPGSITNRLLDRYIERKNRMIHRDILEKASSGVIVLFVGIFSVVFAPSLFYGYLLPVGMIVFGCLVLICAGWDMLVYKRSLSSASKPAEIPSAPSTNKFGSHNPLQLSPPASVTESTTRRLDRSTKPSERG